MADFEEKLSDGDIVQEKVKEFSAIIHTMRHDIRNFIAAIEGYTYLLKEEENINEEYLARIFSNISNITELVDRSVLLTDSDLVIEKHSEINLNIILKACQESIPETVLFQAEELGVVKGDYTKILFVFKSLIENAVIHAEPRSIAIRKNSNSNDGLYQIEFHNDGKTLEKEKVTKLFSQIPQSLKSNSGFSLITSKKIIKAHGWNLNFKHDDEGKSCFVIEIPSEFVIKI